MVKLEKDNTQRAFGTILGKIAAIVAVVFVAVILILAIVGTVFQISEGLSPLQELMGNWPRFLFDIIIAMPLAIFGGIYGGKIASINPRKSGWIMFAIGVISMFDGQFFAGIILIIAGIYTLLFQKPILKQG